MKSMFGVFALAFATTFLGGVVYLTGATPEGGLAVKDANACHTPQDCIATENGHKVDVQPGGADCIACMSSCNCFR